MSLSFVLLLLQDAMGFWFYVDFLVDVFFIVDFVLNFFTGWMDVDRELLVTSFEATSKVSRWLETVHRMSASPR